MIFSQMVPRTIAFDTKSVTTFKFSVNDCIPKSENKIDEKIINNLKITNNPDYKIEMLIVKWANDVFPHLQL